jgi:hypothetical protein
MGAVSLWTTSYNTLNVTFIGLGVPLGPPKTDVQTP